MICAGRRAGLRNDWRRTPSISLEKTKKRRFEEPGRRTGRKSGNPIRKSAKKRRSEEPGRQTGAIGKSDPKKRRKKPSRRIGTADGGGNREIRSEKAQKNAVPKNRDGGRGATGCRAAGIKLLLLFRFRLRLFRTCNRCIFSRICSRDCRIFRFRLFRMRSDRLRRRRRRRRSARR